MAEGPENHSTSSSAEQTASQESVNGRAQGSFLDGGNFPIGGAGGIPAIPIMYPVLVPGLLPQTLDQEQMNRGSGLYAVQSHPFTHSIAGIHHLIPFTYNIPTQPSSPGGVQVRAGEHAQEQQQAGHGRPVVVRRFQMAFQIDLFLILKLAAVIFLFNHDGSEHRLALLVFLASIVYLYQTGALAPVIRWLKQGMQRQGAPRAAARAENALAVEAHENEDDAGENGNRLMDNEPAPQGGLGNRWLALVKEIQMFIFGFVTSLLPGFHHID